MKTMYLMFCLFCLGSILIAQTAWQQETVVRERYQLSSTAVTCPTPQGELFFLYMEESYENRALYLQKYNSVGSPLWNQARVIAQGINSKSRYNIFAADDGNFFIIWSESIPDLGNTMFLRKIDTQGNALWQPENTQLDLPGFWSVSYLPDGSGGLYLLYDRYISGENWDIWGQHVNASGIQLLPNQGVEISNDPLQENAAWSMVASNGTIMFGYAIYGGTFDNQHRILNLNPDFSINWTIDIDSAWTAQHSELVCNILSSDNSVFYFTWKEMSASATKLFMQRFDLQGNTAYPQPILLMDNPDNISLYSSAILTADSNIMVSMHLGSNILPTQNFITKVSPEGNFVWEPATISLPDNIISISALAADAVGGAHFTFKYIPDNTDYRVCTTLQHISANGDMQFPNLGLQLTPLLASTYQHSPRISSVNGNIFTFWMNRYGPEYGYYYNVRNNDGSLIGEELRWVAKGLHGYGELRAVQAREDDVLVIWRDTRNVVVSSPGQYWYQIVNNDGTEDLEPGGALLFDYGTASYNYIKTAYLQNGNTMVIYSYITNSASYIGGQLILPDGSLPWGATGRTFHEFPYVYSLNLVDVYAAGNDVYLAWVMNSATIVDPNRVQKISDGVIQWGAQGLAVNSGLPDAILSEKLFAFRDTYACFLIQVSDPLRYVFWVTRLDANAALPAGWPEDGVIAATVPFLEDSYLSYAAAVYQDNLLLTHSNALDDFGRYHYSIVDAGGQTLVDDQLLFTEPYSQRYIDVDTTSGFGIVAGISDPAYFMPTLKYNKLDASGGFPWGETSVPITPWEHSSIFNMGNIHGFANGAYAVTYINSNKLYCNYINADGTYQQLFGGEPMSPKARTIQMGTVLNDALYLTWHDMKYTNSSTSIGEIRMQKLLNSTVSVSDDLTLQPPLTLHTYPNPFLSSTTLCFDLPKAGDYELGIYNTRGQLVKRIRAEAKTSGRQERVWDGCDMHGRKLASGIYLVRLQMANTVKTSKMTLIRAK